MTTWVVDVRLCPHCGLYHGPACPRIAEIEYYENGTIKRVRYHGQTEATAPFGTTMGGVR